MSTHRETPKTPKPSIAQSPKPAKPYVRQGAVPLPHQGVAVEAEEDLGFGAPENRNPAPHLTRATDLYPYK